MGGGYGQRHSYSSGFGDSGRGGGHHPCLQNEEEIAPVTLGDRGVVGGREGIVHD